MQRCDDCGRQGPVGSVLMANGRRYRCAGGCRFQRRRVEDQQTRIKRYYGYRTPDGLTHVEVWVGPRVQPLVPVTWHGGGGADLRHWAEWGYMGSGCADLSLAILADHLGEVPTREALNAGRQRCWGPHQAFKREVIAQFDRAAPWAIDAIFIARWLEQWETAHADCYRAWQNGGAAGAAEADERNW